MNELILKGRSYKYNFFYSGLNKIIKVYELNEGLIVVNQNEDNTNEVLWGVNTIEDLYLGLELVKNDFNSFIFRYASNYDDVLLKTEQIKRWGYKLKNTYVGFKINLPDQEFIYFNSLTIEKLKLNEIESLMNLEQEIFDMFNVSYSEYEQWLNSNDNLVYVLKNKDELIGFVIYNIYGEYSNLALLRNIGIKKEYQNQQLGTKLLSNTLSLLNNKGIERIMLWVDTNNQNAINLYKKRGFMIDKDECESIFYYEE